MSRSASALTTGRRSAAKQSFRRMNRTVDHSHRNKRRTFAVISALVLIAAAAALAVAVAPLFTR